MRCARSRWGFTLVEAMLVVALIAVLAGAGGGLYSGSYRRLLVERTARQFLLSARYARIMAIEQGRPYELHLDEGNRGFAVMTTRRNPQTAETESVVVSDYYARPVVFEGDVKFEDVRILTLSAEQASDIGAGQRIVFLPNGSAESAVVQIGDGKTQYTVAVVASTGKATLRRGAAGETRMAVIDLDER